MGHTARKGVALATAILEIVAKARAADITAQLKYQRSGVGANITPAGREGGTVSPSLESRSIYGDMSVEAKNNASDSAG